MYGRVVAVSSNPFGTPMITSHLNWLVDSSRCRSVLRTKPMRCGKNVNSMRRPRSRASACAILFSYPSPWLFDNGMLAGSAHTRSTASAPCACAASNRQARPEPSALLERIQVPRLNRAIGAALQVGVQAFPVLHDHLIRTERRH